jgi:hypothetical protein
MGGEEKVSTELEPMKPVNALQEAWDIYRGLSDKADKLPTSVDMTSEDQYCKAKIIDALFRGATITQAAASCGLSSIKAHMMMKRDDTFKECVEMEREMRLSDGADRLEREVWQRALDGERKDSMVLSMFAMKAKRGEYKDSYTTQSDNRVSVNIEIDGKKFDAEFVPTSEEGK